MKKYLGLLLITHIFLMNTAIAQEYPIYIGTYTSGGTSDGIYIYDFNEKTGSTTFSKSIKMSNPSFLTKRGDILYAVNEDTDGIVTAYNLSQDKIISKFPTEGAHPCHIALSPKDPILVVSNYSGGSLILYSLGEKGEILKKDDFIQFTGSSVNKERQNASHIHSAFFNKEGNRLYVSDLGTDIIHVYEIDKVNGNYKLKEVDKVLVKKGGGPRHVALTDNGKNMYVILELTGEVATYKMNKGKWVNTQVLPIYDSNFTGEQGAADIKISPDSRYVYATNRGQANVYARYKINRKGDLKLEAINAVQGNSPRNINLSKQGQWIFISNQLTNNITLISTKGEEQKTLSIPKPVCVIY